MRKLCFFGLINFFSFSGIGRFSVFFIEQKIFSLLFDVFLSVFNQVNGDSLSQERSIIGVVISVNISCGVKFEMSIKSGSRAML